MLQEDKTEVNYEKVLHIFEIANWIDSSAWHSEKLHTYTPTYLCQIATIFISYGILLSLLHYLFKSINHHENYPLKSFRPTLHMQLNAIAIINQHRS